MIKDKRENSKVRDEMLQAIWLIEEKIEPYIQEHTSELDDDWTEDDIRDIEQYFEDVKRRLNYLTLVIDEIGGVKY